MPPNTREELGGLERLDEVVVRADEQAGDEIEPFRPAPGDEDDRQVFAVQVAERTADLVAARSRKVDVEEHEARPLGERRLERLVAVGRLHDRMADPAQQRADELAKSRVVVDDQKRAAVGFQTLLRPAGLAKHRTLSTKCQ